MEIKVQFNVAMVIAVIFAEILNELWFNRHSPWGRRSDDRYHINSVLCDAVLVVLLKYIIEFVWVVGRWEDAMMLSLFLAGIFACLEAPRWHLNHGDVFGRFFSYLIHKCLLMFVMIFALIYFRYLG